MELALIIIISILAVLVIGLLAIMIVLLFKFLKLKESELKSSSDNVGSSLETFNQNTQIPLEAKEKIKLAQSENMEGHSRTCVDHESEQAKGVCSLSGESYCELCLTSENDIKIARKYLDLFLDNEWVELKMIHNDSFGKEELSELMKRRKELWTEESLPLISQNQFKINVEDDSIETYTNLMVRVDDAEYVKSKLEL